MSFVVIGARHTSFVDRAPPSQEWAARTFEMNLDNLQVFASASSGQRALGQTAGGDVVGMWSTAIET